MRRVMALVAIVIVAGCGQAERPYAPQQVPSPSTAASSGPSTPTSGPETDTTGSRHRLVIEWPQDRDPLLNLVTDFYRASRKALASGNDRYLQDLDLELSGVREAYDWVHKLTEEDLTVKGTTRLYNLRVAEKVGKGVQVNACVDETKVRVISARTGKAVASQPDWVRRPYLQAVLAHRGDDGVWRIRAFLYDQKGCTG
ncbi:hypothetical protein ACFOY2_51250 [Nonomuraea purpurea]|uniref:Lipoprotein n=1 Tax=Nonomuraea purpurea TaxID=1849276 RepID=A0ABV8GSG6_9ACTN